jgi:hypothetical protein
MSSQLLPRESRLFIVLTALLQGLLLWLAETGREHGWWPFSALSGTICWYTLVLGVPGIMTMSVLQLGDRRFWQQAALVAASLVLPMTWAAWSASGAPGLQSDAVLGPYGFMTTLALFIALPFLQCRLQHGRWCAPYADLFEHAWQNALTLLLALVFVGICWGVLVLWGSLFHLIGIDFFRDLFRERPFAYLATGGMAGLGILIGRTQHQPIRLALRIVLAIFTGLLPLLAAVALLFAVSLPFTGLAPLWNTRSATAILMTLVALIIGFANAVYQDGSQPPPYPRWLRHFVDAGILSLPVHAGVGLYALFLRIQQYGWTADRYWAALASGVLTAYAIGYAIAVVRRHGSWLALLPRVNIVLALTLIALIAASNSLLLDPHRIGVNDQIARWQSGRTDAKHLDLDHLRFDSGIRGYRAVQSLRTDPRVVADAKLARRLDKVIERRTRHSWTPPEEKRRNAIRDIDPLAALVAPAANSPAPPRELLLAMLARDAADAECRHSGDDCVHIARDLDGDGSTDALICDLTDDRVHCELWDHREGHWWHIGRFDWCCDSDANAVIHAVRAGDITLERRRWPELHASGKASSTSISDIARPSR